MGISSKQKPLVRAVLPALPGPLRGTCLLLALALTFATAESRAFAQFSGPGVKASNPNLNSESVTTDTSVLHPSSRSIFLNPGDLVTVHIFGSLDYQPTVRVALDGTVQLPLIGIVSLRGITIDQAENLIAERLKSAGMYNNPQVTLQVTESTNGVITVAGEGHAVIPASSERRLLEVLAAAGGLPANSSHTVTIDRPGVEKPIVVDLGNDPMHSQQINIPLYPGDTVIVSRVGVVYMLGEFKTPGVIPIQQNSPLTLLQATAVAGEHSTTADITTFASSAPSTINAAWSILTSSGSCSEKIPTRSCRPMTSSIFRPAPLRPRSSRAV